MSLGLGVGIGIGFSPYATATPWSPVAIPGVVFVGIGHDAYYSGGTWTGLVGSVSQGTAGFRPALATAGGERWLVGDGVDDELAGSAVAWIAGGYTVGARYELLDVGFYPCITGTTNTASDPNSRRQVRHPDNTGRPSAVHTDSNVGAGESSAGVPAGTTTSAVGNGVQTVIGRATSATAWEIWQGGTLRDSRSTTANTAESLAWYVFSRGGGQYANMRLNRLVVVNDTVSDADRALLQTWLETAVAP